MAQTRCRNVSFRWVMKFSFSGTKFVKFKTFTDFSGNLVSPEIFFYPDLFLGGHLIFFFLIYKYETQLFLSCHHEKNLGRSYPKKYQVVPYKNMSRFYRVPFTSLLRVQIKQATVSKWGLIVWQKILQML